MRAGKTLVSLDYVAAHEAPGENVQPVLYLERSILLDAICCTFQASWHLCAQHEMQTPAHGLFLGDKCAENDDNLPKLLFSFGCPLPQQANAVWLHMLKGGEVKCVGYMAQVASPAQKQSLSYWTPSTSVRAALFREQLMFLLEERLAQCCTTC